MKHQSLIETNPHLKNAKKRIQAICRSVESSSAIEGVRLKLTAKKQPNGKYKFTAYSE